MTIISHQASELDRCLKLGEHESAKQNYTVYTHNIMYYNII